MPPGEWGKGVLVDGRCGWARRLVAVAAMLHIAPPAATSWLLVACWLPCCRPCRPPQCTPTNRTLPSWRCSGSPGKPLERSRRSSGLPFLPSTQREQREEEDALFLPVSGAGSTRVGRVGGRMGWVGG